MWDVDCEALFVLWGGGGGGGGGREVGQTYRISLNLFLFFFSHLAVIYFMY